MKQDRFDLKGRTVVVTGGLGKLGRHFVKGLLESGAKVVIVDIQGTAPTDKSGRTLYLRADVTSRDSLEQALAVVRKRFGAPWGLVNAAALDSPPDSPPEENGPFETYPVSSWERVMDVNVKGVFLACQVFGRAMAAAKGGSIINIGSTYGLVSPDQRIYEYRAKRGKKFFKPAAYSASKSALVNLTKYLATYWAKDGVRVNLLTLGGVFDGQDKRFLKGYESRVPMGRMARKDEYNGALVFLLSEAASYMTGSDLVIDGGWTAW